MTVGDNNCLSVIQDAKGSDIHPEQYLGHSYETKPPLSRAWFAILLNECIVATLSLRFSFASFNRCQALQDSIEPWTEKPSIALNFLIRRADQRWLYSQVIVFFTKPKGLNAKLFTKAASKLKQNMTWWSVAALALLLQQGSSQLPPSLREYAFCATSSGASQRLRHMTQQGQRLRQREHDLQFQHFHRQRAEVIQEPHPLRPLTDLSVHTQNPHLPRCHLEFPAFLTGGRFNCWSWRRRAKRFLIPSNAFGIVSGRIAIATLATLGWTNLQHPTRSTLRALDLVSAPHPQVQAFSARSFKGKARSSRTYTSRPGAKTLEMFSCFNELQPTSPSTP